MKANILFIIAGLMFLISVAFAYTGYSGNEAISSHYMTDHQWSDEVCIGCHLTAKAQAESSYHVQQDTPQWSTLMNYGMLVEDMNKENPEQIALTHPGGGILSKHGAETDCMICHEQNNNYDYNARNSAILAGNFSDAKNLSVLNATKDAQQSPRKVISYLLNVLTPLPMVTEVHDSINGKPTNEQCIHCHENEILTGGASWDKMNVSHYDVHADLECVDCHETFKHQIGRKVPLDSSQTDRIPVKNCTASDCHESITHGDTIDSHLSQIECQTCHIPNLPGSVENSNGTVKKFSWKNGILEMEYSNESFSPTFAWSNGIYNEQLPLAAQRNDTDAKINTFNSVIGIWWDAGFNPNIVSNASTNSSIGNPISPNIVKAADGNNDNDVTLEEIRSYDSNGDGISDYPNAVLREVNLLYQTSHNIANTDTVLGSPLVCSDCHGNSSKIEWTTLGYNTDPGGNSTDFSNQSFNVTLKKGQKPIEIDRESAF